jgi:glycosyltransferase involved in cell wall biosynthesis
VQKVQREFRDAQSPAGIGLTYACRLALYCDPYSNVEISFAAQPAVRLRRRDSKSMRLSIIMPVYNERRTIREIVRRVLATELPDLERELLIIDDASTDGTREILSELDNRDGIRIVLQPRNLGKGAAVARAVGEASGNIVIVQDADLEYDPAEIPVVLRPILAGEADVVYGSRFLGTPSGHRVLYFWHFVGNRMLTLLSNVFSGLNLTDMETCYKAMTMEVAALLDLRSRRFGVEPEITIKIARLGARVFEVPISYYGRTYEEGKKIGLKDAFLAVSTLLRFAFWRPPRVKDDASE